MEDISGNYRVFKDGDSWCAVGPGFENLAESTAGFGDTFSEAMEDFGSLSGVNIYKVKFIESEGPFTPTQ